MKDVKVIAISGFAKSGKDTSCDYLVNKHGFVRVAFADLLKEMVAKQYDIPLEYLHQQDKKEMPLQQYPVMPKDDFSLLIAKTLFREFRSIHGERPSEYMIDPSGAFLGVIRGSPEQLYFTPRALAIMEGSIKRSANPNYWVDVAINKIYSDTSIKKDNKFVITDMRYKSESKSLNTAFGKNLTTIRINRFASTESTDSSELDLVGYPHHFEVNNTSSLAELYSQLDHLVKGL